MSQIILQRLAQGTAKAAELAALTGLPQATLSRRLADLRAQVLPLGAARSRRYGLLRAIRDLQPEVPVYRISPLGEVARMGVLASLAAGEFWFESSTGNREATRLYPDLPWWMHDLRPQGFLGRQLPRVFPELHLPLDVRGWDAATVLYALARRGDDLMGDLIFGDVAYSRWWEEGRRAQPAVLPDNQRLRRYPQFAAEAMQGPRPGSSAGGEQPKFVARLSTRARLRDVLVKFSAPQREAVGRRWADLLIAEHHALSALRHADLPAANSHIVQADGRVFLEVERFDRVGERGRRGVVSIGAADAEFCGTGGSWIAAARALVREHRLAEGEAARIERISAFGHLIANTDMHAGNLGLYNDTTERPGYGQFRLAPVYDMLPMRYAPVAGEVLTPDFMPPAPIEGLQPAYREMLPHAQAYWERLAEDTDISLGFRRIAKTNLRVLDGLTASLFGA